MQVCDGCENYGYRIVEDMIDGLANWMDEKGFATIGDFCGLSVPKVTEWKHLDLNYKIVVRAGSSRARDGGIGCDLCYIACWDGAHQCIRYQRSPYQAVAALESASRAKVVVTPIAKLDAASYEGNGHTPPHRIPKVDESECVGCNLCWLVCPVENCITMEQVETGSAGGKLGAADAMILIHSGHSVVTARETISADILIDGERIAEVRHGIPRESAETVIDATGFYVIPGGIDVHTHLDMPFGGTTSSDDFETGTRAAAFGGTTTIVDFAIQARGTRMRDALDTWWKKAEGKACIDYGLHMIVTDLGNCGLEDMDEMVDEGVASFKLFMA